MRLQKFIIVLLTSVCVLSGVVFIAHAQSQVTDQAAIQPSTEPAVAANQTAEQPNTEPSVVSAPVANTALPTPMPPAPADGLVSLEFQDADLKNVLKVLAYKSNMNIVSGPEVTGTVTIQLNNVPWQKALEVVLSTYGYGYERRGNIITVTTVENLKKRHEDSQLLADQEPLATKTYLLSFAKASDIIDSITKMKTNRGQINFDQRTNALIIRDVQSNLELIDEVLKALDTPTPQVLIEAKIIETDVSNTENLGIDWSVALNAIGSARPTNFPFTTAGSNTMLPSSFSNYLPGATDTASSNKAGKDFVYGTLDATGLTAALELLSQRSDTNVLSNPRILTLDNQPAKIVVGLKYPLPEYTYNQEQAKLQISGYSFLEIGIIFEVTPHVNNADFVTLDLNPRITAIKSLVQVDPTSTTAKIPELSTEEAKTKVMIKNGQTLVIAGLITENKTSSNSKVPFLGDVPVLGRAFKKSNDKKDKTELMIFLTPHIIVPNTTASSAPASSS